MLKHLPSARVRLVSATLCLLLLAGCSRDPNVRKHKYLESGKKYEKEGKNKEAIIQLSNALKVDHDFADAHFELAKTYLAMGSNQAGVGELRRAIALDGKNIPARVLLGEIAARSKGDPAQTVALEQTKAILALDANNADAYAIMAMIAGNKGDAAGARANMDRAIAIDPNRAAFHTDEALMDARQAELPQAESELEKAIALDPKQADPHLILAAVLEKKGDRSGAEQQDLAAIKEDPSKLRARTALAGLYIRANDLGKAEQVIHQATADTETMDNKDAASTLLNKFYQATKQQDKTEPAYAELVQHNSKSAKLKIVYASILVARRENDKAEPVVAELLKSSGSDPTVQRLNAALQVSSGNLDAAVDTLQKAAKSNAQDADVQIALAQASMMKGDLAAAQTAFQSAAKLKPDNAIPQIGLANIAERRHDYSLLMQIAQQTIAKAPKFPDAYLWRGSAEANTDGGSLDKAAADFGMAKSLSPNSALPLLALGNLKLKQKKIPEATPLFEEALAKDPNSAMALERLTEISMSQKDSAKALARIQAQIAKSPQNVAFYDYLAGVQLYTKDFAGAKDAAGKAMKLNPSDAQAVSNYANAESALGDKDGAISTWTQWSNLHPKDATSTAIIGQLEDSKGDKAKAEEYYKKSLQQEPSQVVAANNLAYLMVTNNEDLDAALTLAQSARRAARSPQDTATTSDTLAWVYYKKGRYSIAKDQLEDAIKTAPADAAMQYHLGMIYSKLGDKTNASAHLKKAQSLDPTGQTGKDATAALAQLG